MKKRENTGEICTSGEKLPGTLALPTLKGVFGILEHTRLSLSGLVAPPKDSLNHGKKAPLYVLVPGFTGTNGTMSVLGSHLARRVNVAYGPEFSFLNVGSLRHSGVKLAQHIRELLDTDGLSRDIRVLAYSNGGIIALEALQSDPRLRIKKLITMGTPFSGTPLAYPLSFVSPACSELNEAPKKAGYDYSQQVLHGIDAHVGHRDSLVPPRSQFPGHALAPGKVRRVDHPHHTHTCFVVGSSVKATADIILSRDGQ